MTMQIISIPGFQEPFNSLSHLVGTVVFAVLGVVLVRRGRGDVRRTLCFSVFVASGILLLSMSGVYHMLPEDSAGYAVLGRLDKAAIFALIAGTNTPLQCLFFRGPARWVVIVSMWLLAATGITLFSIFFDSLPHGLGTGVYLAMGWIAGGSGFFIWRRYGISRVLLLLLGGAFYSVGAILMGLQWPTIVPGVFGPHELWHVAVLVALGLHWKFFLLNAQQSLDGPVSVASADPPGPRSDAGGASS